MSFKNYAESTIPNRRPKQNSKTDDDNPYRRYKIGDKVRLRKEHRDYYSYNASGIYTITGITLYDALKRIDLLQFSEQIDGCFNYRVELV